MPSDYSDFRMVYSCDDVGVYYIRQVGPDDGVEDFDGIVWFGQQLQDEPAFANVFMGRLRLGVDTECGYRVDRWEGRFVDVPKGRTYGVDNLAVRSYVVDASATVGGCDLL